MVRWILSLKRINLETKNVRLYPGVSSITTILEKNARQMWIGTRMGLYQLDKQSGVTGILTCLLNLLIYVHYTREKMVSCILVLVEQVFLFMISIKEVYSSVPN